MLLLGIDICFFSFLSLIRINVISSIVSFSASPIVFCFIAWLTIAPLVFRPVGYRIFTISLNEIMFFLGRNKILIQEEDEAEDQETKNCLHIDCFSCMYCWLERPPC